MSVESKITIEEKLDSLRITDEELISQVIKEYDNALEFRQPRIEDWHANEDMLYGRKPKTLSKRSNIDLRLMKGFEDTLLAKIKNAAIIKFGHTEEADLRKAKKITALWELESSPTKQDWEFKDLLQKKLALPTGRAIDKIFAITPYKHFREIIDSYDFLIDPMAGGYDIEKARYCGQYNIFISKHKLQNNKKYDKARVEELISSYSESGNPINDNDNKEKANRFAILGLNTENYNDTKDGYYKLVEWYTTVEGKRWNVLFNRERRIIIYKKPLVELIGIYEDGEDNPLYPFSSWAYFPDYFNFWSQSPMDIVRENFQTRNIVINQAIDNNEAKNKPMKAYDPNIYKDPSKLEYQPDRLVPVANNGDPARGLFIFPANDIYDPKVLNDMLEDIAAKVSGITPAGQGQEVKDQKVGIYYGNQQEVASRMDTFEKSYSRANMRNALLYLNGLKDHLDEEMAVKMIGENGVEWDKITKEDLTEFDITITGGSTEAALNALKAKQKAEFVARHLVNQIINQKALTEADAVNSGFSPDEIRKLFDKDDATDEMLSKASQDIQKLLEGEKLLPYLKANTAYMQKILDFMMDNDMTPAQDKKFMAYLVQLQPIAIRNMVMKAQFELARQGKLPTPNLPGQTPPATEPLPNTPGGTISQSLNTTNLVKPNYAPSPVQ